MCVTLTQIMGVMAGLFFAYVYQRVMLRHLDAPRRHLDAGKGS
jgi:hypothetical protein